MRYVLDNNGHYRLFVAHCGHCADDIVVDIEKETIENIYFRKVISTNKYSQLVVMSLKPGEDIGEESHDVDQFFRIESGTGLLVLNNTKTTIKAGDAFTVPAQDKHNIINTSKDKDLKLYTVYSPPHHPAGTVHKTKKEAAE